MTDTIQPSVSAYDHLMVSQSGNIQDLNAYSGLSSSFIIGSDPESDSTSRQEFAHHHPPIPSEMGLRYMTIPAPEDSRFSSEGTPQQSPVYSVEPSITPSTPSTIAFPYPNVFPPALSNSSSFSNSGSSYFSTNLSNYCLSDIKSTLNTFPHSSDMPPPSRSPHLPHLGSPQTTRELYANAAPQLRRASELLSRSPSATGTMRGVPLSPSSSSGFASPANLDSPQLANNQDGPPPLQATQHLYELRTTDGQKVRPEIIGKIDKGFFMAENDWTCYRRNYFQISCSYALHPSVPLSTIHLVQDGAPSMQVHAFAMSISAVVDGENGKPIELVQHTPKRDKGPQAKPERIVLLPRSISPTMYGVSGDSSLGSAPRSLFEPNYSQTSSQPPTDHTFERIQFKQATANNGKRRARQQYYHLIVELFADLGPQAGSDRWTEIARRTSVPMVVRGRSPGHYHNERRGSNASAGPGGSNGQGGGMGSYGSGGGIGRALGDMPMSGSSNILQGNNYGGSYDTSRSRRYLSSSGIDIPADPIMPAEDDKSYHDLDGYYYYPHTMHEGSVGSGLRSQALPPYQPHRDDRGHLSMANYASHNPSRVKQEFSGYSLPSLSAGPLDQFGRNCGRFEGVPTSRGYYPTAPFVHSEINSS